MCENFADMLLLNFSRPAHIFIWILQRVALSFRNVPFLYRFVTKFRRCAFNCFGVKQVFRACSREPITNVCFRRKITRLVGTWNCSYFSNSSEWIKNLPIANLGQVFHYPKCKSIIQKVEESFSTERLLLQGVIKLTQLDVFNGVKFNSLYNWSIWDSPSQSKG